MSPGASPDQNTALEDVAAFAATLNNISRPIIKKWFRQAPDIEKKSDLSPVTIADKSVEAALRDAIMARFPDHGIIGEEEAAKTGGGDFTWVIDPIDGTRAFTCGSPLFGTLIAVLMDDRPVVGIIDLPALDQCWIGVKGRPTLHNGMPVTTSGLADLNAARTVTTSSVALGRYHARFDQLATRSMVTGYGGDCANYAHLASGWCDIVAEANLAPYDIMASIPVITGAGGCVTRWDGEPIRLDDYDGTALATASPALHDHAISALG
ncbi:MAG: hypothetical protein CBD43_00450 [Gammaproteobacteria bacterium TMED183]|jgi:inositol-phosphate phosphatase/L-galactose 1-phosphate phosphatase/histidinol-phosphatase|nr:histidinol phosphate phosphatase [SAR116 cluster bacterium]OUW37560.1 MAG: hypothetical protein CBD43_00450 [Gammaproteobacteria bacterium TMED183]HCV62507.1 histidinol phosphate phosphatase [Alphaproteobacteria bacterium]